MVVMIFSLLQPVLHMINISTIGLLRYVGVRTLQPNPDTELCSPRHEHTKP